MIVFLFLTMKFKELAHLKMILVCLSIPSNTTLENDIRILQNS